MLAIGWVCVLGFWFNVVILFCVGLFYLAFVGVCLSVCECRVWVLMFACFGLLVDCCYVVGLMCFVGCCFNEFWVFVNW